MTITIPTWILWALGGVAGLGVLALALFGAWILWFGRKIDLRINW